MLPKVFEMFSQVGRNLDRAQGGLGIGLTLVRRLTEMHGGSVSAESHGMGTGSTFSVRIPAGASAASRRRTRDAERGRRRRARPAPPARARGRRQRRRRAHAVAAVGMHGHETAMAHNGPDALKALATFRPQLAFVDIGLPGLNGYEVAGACVLERRAATARAVILVALTGWGSDEDKARSREAGFDLHLTKPVDPHEVEALLNGLVSHEVRCGSRRQSAV